jgi:hypothetical protein
MKRRFKLKLHIKDSRQTRRESAEEELSKSTMSNTPTNVNIAAVGIWQEVKSRKKNFVPFAKS